MKLPYIWFAVVTMLWLGACGGGESGLRDPGRPAVPYGSRCSVTLGTSPVESLQQCTAIATISEGAAHLYLELHPDREPAGVSRYASLVLMIDEWKQGRFTQAMGGRIEIGLTDGRRYRLPVDGGRSFPIDLDVSSALPAETGDHYYLRGELNAALPGVSADQDRLDFKMIIN